jgi:hypothetical protein
VIFRPNNERIRFEVLIETSIRKQLRLKAHTVSKVVEQKDGMIVHMTVAVSSEGSSAVRRK